VEKTYVPSVISEKVEVERPLIAAETSWNVVVAIHQPKLLSLDVNQSEELYLSSGAFSSSTLCSGMYIELVT
jgi:hypothetical protein